MLIFRVLVNSAEGNHRNPDENLIVVMNHWILEYLWTDYVWSRCVVFFVFSESSSRLLLLDVQRLSTRQFQVVAKPIQRQHFHLWWRWHQETCRRIIGYFIGTGSAKQHDTHSVSPSMSLQTDGWPVCLWFWCNHPCWFLTCPNSFVL